MMNLKFHYLVPKTKTIKCSFLGELFMNLSVSSREKFAKEASDSLPSPLASKNTDVWCSLTSPTLDDSV